MVSGGVIFDFVTSETACGDRSELGCDTCGLKKRDRAGRRPERKLVKLVRMSGWMGSRRGQNLLQQACGAGPQVRAGEDKEKEGRMAVGVEKKLCKAFSQWSPTAMFLLACASRGLDVRSGDVL